MNPNPDSPNLDAALSPRQPDGADALHRFGHQAEALAHQTAAQLRQRAQWAHDSTLLQIREHPLRSVLLAAGVGAALTLLIRQLSKR